MKVSILRNEDPSSSKKWEISCQKANLDYTVIDLTASDWYESIINSNSELFLLRPPGETFKFKQVYDERVFIISEVLKFFVFPTVKEILIYENKRMLSAFLKGANIPLPQTWIFYNKNEALKFAQETSLPVVGKTRIGASGSGVEIIKTHKGLDTYIRRGFGKGIKRRLGPNRSTGNVRTWSKKAVANPAYFIKKIRQYLEIYKDSQKGFIILQEYVPHEFEWRIVKIGESWFGHQKIKMGEKASGTKGINYITPPIKLLDFCRNICEEHNFTTMALDIFEHPKKGYVVNELQTIFGHVQEYLMECDGKIGRYIFENDQWHFEPGDFNTNESYDLRLESAIALYERRKK